MEDLLQEQKNKELNRGALTAFFAEILSLCDMLRRVRERSQSNFIKLSYEYTGRKNECLLKVGEEQTAEKLVNFFFMFCQCGGADIIQVSQSEDIAKERYRKWKLDYIWHQHYEEQESIHNICSEIIETFLEDEIKCNLNNQLLEYGKKVKNIEEDGSAFLSKQDIYKLLNCYYEILRTVLCEQGCLQDSLFVEKALIPVLNLGMRIDKENGKAAVGLHAPTFLAALNVIYDCLNQYLLLPEAENEYWNQIYHEIFLAKLQQALRYYMVLDKNEILYSAAVPIYSLYPSQERNLEIPVRKIKEYNSYQGIQELRIAEKILHEINQMEYEADREFHIAMLGDIHEEPLRELCRYLKKVCKVKNYNFPKLFFSVYTYNGFEADEGDEGEGYHYQRKQYDDLLLRPNDLKKVIRDNQLLFFLDSRQLYDPLEVEPCENLNMFRQEISFENYEQYYKRNRCGNDLQLRCKFMELYQGFVGYCYKDQFGTLKKRAKGELVRFIQKEVMSQPHKAAYIYVSDIRAFEQLFCVKEHFVRIEKYNQKQIGIIRFSAIEEANLDITYKPGGAAVPARKIIVFNIWQFIKHILLDKAEEFVRLLLNGSSEYLLSDLYVGLDYTDWKTQIKVSYYFQDKEGEGSAPNRSNIETYLRSVIIPALNGGDNMYFRYLKNSFISFLYSGTKSVEDLLFLHIYDNYQSRIGMFIWEEKHAFDPDIINYYNKALKYSFKKFYWDALKQFDVPSKNNIGQYRTLLSVEQSSKYETEQSDRIHVANDFIKKIMKACEYIGYQDSYLFENCKEKIQEGVRR